MTKVITLFPNDTPDKRPIELIKHLNVSNEKFQRCSVTTANCWENIALVSLREIPEDLDIIMCWDDPTPSSATPTRYIYLGNWNDGVVSNQLK